MKLKETIELYKNQGYTPDQIEIYKPSFKNDDSHSLHFHTDFIDGVMDYTGEEEVITDTVMDMEEYNNSVLANCGMNAKEFMDENDRIVCILIEKERAE